MIIHLKKLICVERKDFKIRLDSTVQHNRLSFKYFRRLKTVRSIIFALYIKF